MKELYGFSINDFLIDIWSDPNDCKKEWSLLVALLSSSLAGVLNGEAEATSSTFGWSLDASTLSGLTSVLTSFPGVLSIVGLVLFFSSTFSSIFSSVLVIEFSSLLTISSSTTSRTTLGVDATDSLSWSLSCFFWVSIDNWGFSLASAADALGV